jgi:hypothetical protein
VRCAGCGQTLRVPTTAGAQRPSRPEQPRAERPSEPLDEAAVLTEVARAVSSHAVDGREPRRWGGLVTVLIVLLVAGGGAVAWQMGYIKLDAINPPPSPQEIARQANDERSRRLFKVELVGSDTQTTPVNLQLKLTNTAGKDIRSFIGSVFLYSADDRQLANLRLTLIHTIKDGESFVDDRNWPVEPKALEALRHHTDRPVHFILQVDHLIYDDDTQERFDH